MPDSVKNHSRSSISSDSYDIHTVSVDFGESRGYVILSDTPEINQVFYYTEEGSISDTIQNGHLKDMIDIYPEIAAEIISGKIEGTRNYIPPQPDMYIEPLVRFTWHQGYPYNLGAAYCDCASCSQMGKHKPAGCVTIAVAQVLAAMKKFRGTFFGNRDIDFDNLPSRYNSYATKDQILTLTSFIQEIALNCQIQFTCKGSSTSAEEAVNYIRDMGIDVDHVVENLNTDRFIRNLQNGLPHLICGVSKQKKGHMWILDGFKRENGTGYYHINWGNGNPGSNGWSIFYNYQDFGDHVLHYHKNHQQLYFG